MAFHILYAEHSLVKIIGTPSPGDTICFVTPLMRPIVKLTLVYHKRSNRLLSLQILSST